FQYAETRLDPKKAMRNGRLRSRDMRQLPDAQLAAYPEQLLHPMRAGVAAQNGPIAPLRHLLREGRIGEQALEMATHLATVVSHQIVPARREESLAVLPRSGHERQAACKCFEDPDRRNARKLLAVEPARHVHREPRAREERRYPEVCHPAAILDSGIPERADRLGGVAHAIDACAQREIPHRTDQIFHELVA